MSKLNGLGVALITPFDKDGAVDYDALERLVTAHVSAQTDYLVVLGTTAETPTLSFEEKQLVVKTVVEKSRGNIPLVLGLGGNHTQSIVDELNRWDLSPFEAILSVTPYYNRPTQQGLIAHYQYIADRAAKPIILYNVPSRTGVNMLPDTVADLAKHPNIVGVKEAVGDKNQILNLLQQVPEDFLVISGDDHLAPFLVHHGGVGCISVIGNAFPNVFKALLDESVSNPNFENSQVFIALQPIIDLIFKEGNPAGVKALLELLHYNTNVVRLPLVAASHALSEELKNALTALEFEAL